MCGFVAILTAPGQTISGGVLKRMTGRLAHRGPDDVGYACVDPATGWRRAWRDELRDREPLTGAVFGHRRLSILDLTPAGHQPMISDDGSLVLAYNGEVYNFVELREQLASLGSTFRGRGDTEVLLRAYEHWGAAAVERLNGMWAFAVWDGRRRALVASRDRFGVKPLYYTVVDGAWVFASEIKALLAYPGAFRGHDERRVHAFLARSAADEDAGTMFRGVRAVPPASTLEVAPGARPDAVTPRTFWSPRVDPGRRARPEGALVEEMAALLADAVRLRLRSDVPVGTMLSGGLDSTSIAVLIDEQRRRGHAGAGGDGASVSERGVPPLQTFTASFPGWSSDESADAELVCARLGLPSHRVCPSAESLADAMPAVAYALDEPFRTPTAVVQYLLMREAAARGVKVVLNGHGSDETFGGYPRLFIAPLLAGMLARGEFRAFARERRAFAAAGGASPARLARVLLAQMTPASLKPGLRRLRARREAWRWRHVFALSRASGGANRAATSSASHRPRLRPRRTRRPR